MNPRWRVRYCDGSIYDNLTSTPQELPGKGVQTVIQWNNGREILQGFHIYYWMEDLQLWWAGDFMGFLELAENDDKVKFPKRGLNCRNFQEILDETVLDKDFDPAHRRLDD
jgi:hypothetical protein